MRRLKPIFLAPAFAVLALWAGGSAGRADVPGKERAEPALWPAAAAPPVELTAPRHGETLVAGTTGILEWTEGQDGEAVLAKGGFDEWEAFLSLDGGRTYPLRLTPHLELETRRVAFEVPGTPTDDARLLLRFGNGRRDYGWKLPQRFSIVASPWPGFTSLVPALTVTRIAETAVEGDDDDEAEEAERERGERPLPGQPGVAAWVEGTAQGTGLHWVYAERSHWLDAGERPVLAAASLAGMALESPPAPGLPAPLARLAPAAPRERLAALAASLPHPTSLDILTWTQRRNE